MFQKVYIGIGVLTGILLSAAHAHAFGPCDKTVPKDISYLPHVAACGNRAAIVLRGPYINAFSVVLRDCNNGDRDPCYGRNGEPSCGTNQSSPFKVQKVVDAVTTVAGKPKKKVAAKIHCLKEPGDAEVYRLVRRFTIKLRNPVRSPSDVLKICLSSRTTAANPVEIVSTGNEALSSSFGYTSICATQKYMACNVDYFKFCPRF